jgi:Tol biopolymer transport system component
MLLEDPLRPTFRATLLNEGERSSRMAISLEWRARTLTQRAVSVWLVLTLVAAACSEGASVDPAGEVQITAATAGASQPGEALSGRIAFESYRDGNSEIYVIDADGSNLVRLTDDPAQDGSPAWSPDGTRIAFDSMRDGDWDVYVMDADGSNVTNLTNNPASDQTNNPTFHQTPTWSPDGSHIAFYSHLDGPGVYVMDADGSNLTQLADSATDPAWSPDGARISFASDPDFDGDWGVYVIDVDGSNVTNLADNLGFGGFPSWSPDGTRIAFESDRDGNFEVYVMDADGSNLTRLTDDPAFDESPTWSPDGSHIAFYSDRVGSDAYVMNADGSNVTRLTDSGANNPAWSPAP